MAIDGYEGGFLPDYDLAPVIHARWVDSEPDKPDYDYHKYGMSWYCSNCKHRAGKFKHKTYRYCPWCGARMLGDAEHGRNDS